MCLLRTPGTPKMKTVEQVLDFITSFTASHNYAPTVREIQTALKFSSPSVVSARLATLRDEGSIEWEPGLPRTIRVIEQPCID